MGKSRGRQSLIGKSSSGLGMNLLQNDGGRRSFAPATAINEEASSSHHGSFRSKSSSKFEADPFEREPDDVKSRFDSETSSDDLSEKEDLEI